MPVQEAIPHSEAIGNGVSKSFALGFPCEKKESLKVKINEIEVSTEHWFLNQNTVIFNTAPETNVLIQFERSTKAIRTTDYATYNDSLRGDVLNYDFDRIWWKLQELGLSDWLLRQHVDRKDDELRAYLMEETRKQGVALDQLDEYCNYLMQRLAQIAVSRGWDASFIADAGGSTQQDINDFGGAKWRNKAGGYALGATVKLDNGDIVKSTIENNTTNPNIDMTGWKFNDNTVESIAELIAIQSPKDDQTIFVKSQIANGLVGGGYYTYNSSKSSWGRIVTNLIVSPETFGAAIDKPDNTQEIQKALLFVQTNGGYVDGGYKKYKAANIVIDSNMSLRNIYLDNNVFNQNLVSVITTDGADAQRTPIKNVQLINVHIDGKRNELTGMPTGSFSEDGGRHGFRFVRPIDGLVMRGCSANYCGVEGIMIFPIRDIPHAEWKHYVKNVVIENCDFHFNGRHGGSSDSVDGLKLRNIRASGNGLDTIVGAPQTSGGAGRKDPVSGKLYGVGWDFEEYLPEAYSINISIEYCVMTGNAGSGAVFVRTGGILQPTRNVTFLGGKYDKGVEGVAVVDASISLGGYLIDNYNWYDITFIDVDFSAAALYVLRSKATLINPKNLLNVTAVDGSTVVSDKDVTVVQDASTVTVAAHLEVKPDGLSHQQVIGVSGAIGATSSSLFYDKSSSKIRGGIEVESGGVASSTLYIGVGGSRKWGYQSNGSVLPEGDATQNIGWTSRRIGNIYLANAPVVSSDARYKTDIKDISDIEKNVASELKKNIKTYTLIGSDDQIHVGMIAQEVVSIFASYGLDAHDYNMINFEEGSYSIRYEELIMFILST